MAYQEKEKKSNSKTFRYTDTTKKYIEAADGNGYNEKLENLVYNAHIALPEIVKEVIDRKKKLKELDQAIQEKRALLQKLEQIEYFLNSAIRYTQD